MLSISQNLRFWDWIVSLPFSVFDYHLVKSRISNHLNKTKYQLIFSPGPLGEGREELFVWLNIDTVWANIGMWWSFQILLLNDLICNSLICFRLICITLILFSFQFIACSTDIFTIHRIRGGDWEHKHCRDGSGGEYDKSESLLRRSATPRKPRIQMCGG